MTSTGDGPVAKSNKPLPRLLRRHSGYRFRRRLRGLARAFARGELRPAEVRSRIASWVGHAEHAETWGLRRAIFAEVQFHSQL